MKRERLAVQGGATTTFVREWNLAFLLVTVVAGLLFATGYLVAGFLATGLCVTAVVGRYAAMRKQGRGFYGQEKHPTDAVKRDREELA